jgi:hypothetical protein
LRRVMLQRFAMHTLGYEDTRVYMPYPRSSSK